jgi:hypothetical protein
MPAPSEMTTNQLQELIDLLPVLGAQEMIIMTDWLDGGCSFSTSATGDDVLAYFEMEPHG